MNKKNCVLAVLIFLSIGVLSCYVYESYQNFNIEKRQEKENVNDEENVTQQNENSILDESDNSELDARGEESSILLEETYLDDEVIIQKYKLICDDGEKELTIKFELDTSDDDWFHITGTLNNNVVYSLTRDTWDSPIEDYFTTDYINETFNENNFDIIEGTDNTEYLLVYYEHLHSEYYEKELLIFNNNLDLLNNYSDFIIVNGITSFVVENEENIFYGTYDYYSILLKIEDNKIYLLQPIKDDEESYENGTIEERVYTINIDELTYELINTYNITKYAGGF